jgi:peroxiredoxin
MENPQHPEQGRHASRGTRKKVEKENAMNMLRLILAVILLSGLGLPQTQNPASPLRPAILGGPMPDFALPALGGGEITVSKLKGKNVLLVFPRGKVDNSWCQICHYEYADLAELEKVRGLRGKYNLEILFVLPYDKATVQHWVDIFPDQMAVIEEWKNPPASAGDRQKAFAKNIRRLLPKTFVIPKGNVPTPFPILIDADQKVSKGLGLFSTNWDQSAVDQNIPTVFLLDGTGTVRFKYFSQNTFDRPNAAYLEKVLDRLLSEK